MKTGLLTVICLIITLTAVVAQAARFVRYEAKGQVNYGEVVGDTVYELSGSYLAGAERTGTQHELASVTLHLPVDPGEVSKILGTAVNTKRPTLSLPENPHPRWFAKFPSSLNPDGGGVMLPPEAENLNYEGELVVVIGKTARHVTEDRALDYVFGYTVGNDFSENTWYGERKGREEPARLISKGSDTWACLGSEVVTDIDYRNRRLVTRLNNEIVQDGNTNDLIQDVPELIAYVSRYITLEPGDLIYTGTVLFKEDARRKMQIGDELEVAIEGIGRVRSTIVPMLASGQ